ncbi:hypothetical protein HPP92_023541 [Vanilla planifolia]|uniref:Uncharacterized protein n=1 Tax=Vanilla planifolia TaxID=51239 RepID=A0A835PVJ0_VANPL|nr:hypothetical protein HPP92_023541 [Vanilla planifolia]
MPPLRLRVIAVDSQRSERCRGAVLNCGTLVRERTERERDLMLKSSFRKVVNIIYGMSTTRFRFVDIPTSMEQEAQIKKFGKLRITNSCLQLKREIFSKRQASSTIKGDVDNE